MVRAISPIRAISHKVWSNGIAHRRSIPLDPNKIQDIKPYNREKKY